MFFVSPKPDGKNPCDTWDNACEMATYLAAHTGKNTFVMPIWEGTAIVGIVTDDGNGLTTHDLRANAKKKVDSMPEWIRHNRTVARRDEFNRPAK